MARAEFIGLDKMSGYNLRLYNILGDHALNGNTVMVNTLVKEGIEILDMTQAEIEKELEKIKKFMEE